MTQRLAIPAGALGTLSVTALLNLWLALLMGLGECRGDGVEVREGSPKEAFCEIFQDPNDVEVLLGALVLYGPTLLALAGGALAAVRRSGRLLALTAAGAAVWLLAILVPMLVLPG
jgi:hypothetical protein